MSTLNFENEDEQNDGPSLSDAVRDGLDPVAQAAPKEDVISVRQAKRAKPLRQSVSNRSNVRVLFITADASFLEPGTPAQQHFADIAQFMAEIHIMFLRTGTGEMMSQRPMPNVWIYHVYGKYRFQRIWSARQAAKHHLTFSNVVRPDMIVALDPFEAGLAARTIAKMLKRPWQVHLRINPFNLDWLAQKKGNQQLGKLARRVLNSAPSARTANQSIADALTKRFKRLTDVAVLPRRYNLSAYEVPMTDDIHATYRQFSFIMLAEGPLQAESHLHEVIAGTHQILRSERIGLVIIGTGRAKQLFVEKAKLLGIERNVVFVDDTVNRPLYYQTADIFIEADAGLSGDERVLRAIAAHTPVVAYTNEFRSGFLKDGQSALLCEEHDSYTLGQAARRLLNDQSLRHQFALRAASIANEQIHEDVTTYFKAYRSSITTGMAILPDDA